MKYEVEFICKLAEDSSFSLQFEAQLVPQENNEFILIIDDQNQPLETLYKWIIQIYDLDGEEKPREGINFLKATIMLKNEASTRTFEGCWPRTVNWNDLDMVSKTTIIELKIHYDKEVL